MSGTGDTGNGARTAVLTVNGGSSSIKFALFDLGPPLSRRLQGRIERVGLPDARLAIHDLAHEQRTEQRIAAADHRAAADVLLDWLDGRMATVRAVGHRVVQGMHHAAPERVTRELLDDLHRMVDYDPAHLPYEIELMERLCQRYPELAQIACFDTSFHRTLPPVARVLPIPRRYEARGIRRYGFHGISYAYLLQALARAGGAVAASGRVVLAHLGNGASMAAVRGGRSVDTSMGFTPAGGLVMGTRAGDLDPGVAWYLMRAENLGADAFNELVNRRAGLIGVSETSSDMRDLLEREATDPRAAEAVELFCYQAKKWLGAYVAVLGGLDTLVFSGGIGENAPAVRRRICAGLEFLGIALDHTRNDGNAAVISAAHTPVTVRVIHTDEESMIATYVCRALGLTTGDLHECTIR